MILKVSGGYGHPQWGLDTLTLTHRVEGCGQYEITSGERVGDEKKNRYLMTSEKREAVKTRKKQMILESGDRETEGKPGSVGSP